MDISETLNVDSSQIVKLDKLIEKLINSEKNRVYLPSGSINFDKVLGDSFKRYQMYLIFGANSTGKTQICHQLCVQAYKQFIHQKDNLDRSDEVLTYYLDCENTFRPERIKEIANTQNLDDNQVLKSILVSKILSNNALLLKLNEIEQNLNKPSESTKQNQIRLLIIDSINNYFRTEQGNKDISFLKVKLTFLKILSILTNITKQLNLITITTAQVSPIFSEEDSSIVKEKPVGNQFLNHFFSEYLYLSAMEKDKKYIHLINSISLPERRVLYKITSKGIEDHKI